jgi:hypothetical protein
MHDALMDKEIELKLQVAPNGGNRHDGHVFAGLRSLRRGHRHKCRRPRRSQLETQGSRSRLGNAVLSAMSPFDPKGCQKPLSFCLSIKETA